MLALNLGANEIEPDINIGDNGQMIIYHGGSRSTTKLIDYLQDLHAITLAHPSTGTLVFDCKHPAHSPDNGLTLLMAIRERLTFDLPLNVLFLVANLNGVSMFANIHSVLCFREGLLIDDENNPVGVANYLNGISVGHCS